MLKNQAIKDDSKKLNQIHKQLSKLKRQLEAINTYSPVVPDETRTEKQSSKEN